MPISMDSADDLQNSGPQDYRMNGNINPWGYKVLDSHGRDVALGTAPPSVNFCPTRPRCGFDRTRVDGGVVEDRCGRGERGRPDCCSELLESWRRGFYVQVCCMKFLGCPTWCGAGDLPFGVVPCSFRPRAAPAVSGWSGEWGPACGRGVLPVPEWLGCPKILTGIRKEEGGGAPRFRWRGFDLGGPSSFLRVRFPLEGCI